MQEKFDFRRNLNLDIQIGSGFGHILKSGSVSRFDNILKTGSGFDTIVKHGSGPDLNVKTGSGSKPLLQKKIV